MNKRIRKKKRKRKQGERERRKSNCVQSLYCTKVLCPMVQNHKGKKKNR